MNERGKEDEEEGISIAVTLLKWIRVEKNPVYPGEKNYPKGNRTFIKYGEI